MSTWEELLDDARARLDMAAERLLAGDWRRGVFELGCAYARIIQVVEGLPESATCPLAHER